jgi:hypothetical protein
MEKIQTVELYMWWCYQSINCKVPPTNYHILWLVPVAAHAVLSTSDDGCKEQPKHVEKSCSEKNIDC